MKRNRFEEKLLQYCNEYGLQMNEAIECVDKIKQAIAEELPKESNLAIKNSIHKRRYFTHGVILITDTMFDNGWNDCLSEVRKRLGIK